MCKYCKRLKQLKDLDEKRYKEIIHAWQRRDLDACNLIAWMYCMLDKDFKLLFRSRVNDILNCDWIGK